LDDSSETIFDGNISSVSLDGKWAVGYSFSHVYKCMPGYGYIHVDRDTLDTSLSPSNHGISIINVSTGQRRLLFSIHEFLESYPIHGFLGYRHFFSHAVFSPNSRRFMFLHRWVNPEGPLSKRFSRLVSMSIDGNDICIFPTLDMVSHMSWRTDTQIIAYCRIASHDDQYVLFDDLNPLSYEVVGLGKFSSDGHPSFDSTGRWMITDTYPDKFRVQNLVLFDLLHDRRVDVAQFRMPKMFRSGNDYQHWAVDLHPRWSNKSHVVCFDSAHDKCRSLCTVDLDLD